MRRFFVSSFLFSELLCGLAVFCSATPWHRYQLEPAQHAPFVYGVASGDPFADSILLWTYAKIPEGDRVVWSVWLPGSGSFENNVTSGDAAVSGSQGHTVTVEAAGLAPDTVYNYAFEYQGNRSRLGRTRTAPDPQDETFEEMKVAVMSCSRVWNGFFNAYREVALREDLHLVLHVVRCSLSAYIYACVSILMYRVEAVESLCINVCGYLLLNRARGIGCILTSSSPIVNAFRRVCVETIAGGKR